MLTLLFPSASVKSYSLALQSTLITEVFSWHAKNGEKRKTSEESCWAWRNITLVRGFGPISSLAFMIRRAPFWKTWSEWNHVDIAKYHVIGEPFQCFDIKSSYAVSATCMPNNWLSNIVKHSACTWPKYRDLIGRQCKRFPWGITILTICLHFTNIWAIYVADISTMFGLHCRADCLRRSLFQFYQTKTIETASKHRGW